MLCVVCVFFFQAEDGIRDLVRSRGLGDVYKRQEQFLVEGIPENVPIQIINTAGQVVNEMQSMESVLYVNISEYPTGCYLLRYKNDNTFETIPFVISR